MRGCTATGRILGPRIAATAAATTGACAGDRKRADTPRTQVGAAYVEKRSLSSFNRELNVNTSSIATTQALNSQTGYSLSIRASSGPARPEGTDDSSEVRRLRHRDHEHHHDHDHRTSRSDDQGYSGSAFTSLKLKIEETFSSLTGRTGTDAEDSTSSSEFEGEFQARIQFSGPDGEFKAKLKFSLDSDSATAGADFASAMQGFAQTLFAALNALYGGGSTPALPGPTESTTPVGTDPAATPALPAPPPAPAPVADDTVAAAPAPAANPEPIVVAPPASPSTPTTGSFSPTTTSFSIKLRATYDSFENNLGPLVNQLAQPDVGNAFPALTSLLQDLADRFGQLVSQAPAEGSNAPSLQDFLQALSGSFFTPQPEASADPATADPSTPALPAPQTDAPPTDPVVTDAPTAPAPTSQRFTAMAQYRQVLTYSDAGSSLSLQTSMSARLVYEVA